MRCCTTRTTRTSSTSPHSLASAVPHAADDARGRTEALRGAARLMRRGPCLEVASIRAPPHRGARPGEASQDRARTVPESMEPELDTATPSIPYRETITIAAEARYRHKKQSGGAGQFGEVTLKIEPLPRGSGHRTRATIKGVIPGSTSPPSRAGIRQAAAEACSPAIRRRTCGHGLDGKHHTVDSGTRSRLSPRPVMHCSKSAQRPPAAYRTPSERHHRNRRDSHFGRGCGARSVRRGRLTGTDSGAGRDEIRPRYRCRRWRDREPLEGDLRRRDSLCRIEFRRLRAVPGGLQQNLVLKRQTATTKKARRERAKQGAGQGTRSLLGCSCRTPPDYPGYRRATRLLTLTLLIVWGSGDLPAGGLCGALNQHDFLGFPWDSICGPGHLLAIWRSFTITSRQWQDSTCATASASSPDHRPTAARPGMRHHSPLLASGRVWPSCAPSESGGRGDQKCSRQRTLIHSVLPAIALQVS